MQNRYFSDEELVAYLDGEADFAPVAEIDSALASDTALQARLDALDVDRDALRSEFADLVPDHALIPPAPRRRRGLWAGVTGLAAAASLAIGFVIGSAQNPGPVEWTEYVAAYQALYSSSTLAHIDVSATEQQVELDRVASAIGKSIEVEDLSLLPDVTYRRAQILSFQGQALVQLAFETSTGDPIALCIIRSDRPADPMPKISEMEGLSTALWSQNGYDYILIGGENDALITRMSATFVGMRL